MEDVTAKDVSDILGATINTVYTTTSSGGTLTESSLNEAVNSMNDLRKSQVEGLINEAKRQFFVDKRNRSMKINQDDWPSQRQYLKFWLSQINHALLKSRKEIGKPIIVDIIGSKTENILEQEVVSPQQLSVRISTLTEKEVNTYIMGLIKGKNK